MLKVLPSINKTGMQEVSREILMLNSLLTLVINDKSLLSKGYIEKARVKRILSNSEFIEKWIINEDCK